MGDKIVLAVTAAENMVARAEQNKHFGIKTNVLF